MGMRYPKGRENKRGAGGGGGEGGGRRQARDNDGERKEAGAKQKTNPRVVAASNATCFGVTACGTLYQQHRCHKCTQDVSLNTYLAVTPLDR